MAALALPAGDRSALVEKILLTDEGSQVRVRLTDGTMVKGRLLRVENDAIQLQVERAGAIATREVPIAQIAAFEVPRPSEFGRGFRKGAGRAMGAVAVLIVLGLIVSAISH